MANIFFSYSHKDETLRDKLEAHLSMLKHQGAIETWHDRRITTGDDFAGVIDARLEAADLILLLVSADFLNSKYCFDVEMKRAMERHVAREARVIPIILRPCDWHSAPFGKLLAVPTDGKPVTTWPDIDEALVDVVLQLRAALPTAAHPAAFATPHSPAPVTAITSPRSSNLRLRKQFSDADRDRFLDDGFAFMAKFFEATMNELVSRNEGVEARFKQIDAQTFTCAIYRHGAVVSRCKVTLGGLFGKGLVFSFNDNPSDNSANDRLTVENDDQSLFFRTLGMAHIGRSERRNLSFEGASEHFWALFIAPLQR